MSEIQTNSIGILTKACVSCGSDDIQLKPWKLRNNFKLGSCNNCGFHFAQPRPTFQYLIDYYNSISNSRFYKHTDDDALKSTRDILRLIRAHHPSAKRVLEIGCSTAYYLQGLKLEGYEVAGTELSQDACNLAQEWYGITVYNTEFPPDSYKNAFDVIIVHHVIEHVLEPREFLAKADQYLSNNGILILETPNVQSAGIRIFKRHYPVLCPPGHLNFFSLATLGAVIPASHKIVYGETTSECELTIYNSVIAMMSMLRVKSLFNKLVSRRVQIGDSTVSAIETNRKFAYGKILAGFSRFFHIVLYPIFYVLDKAGSGENLGMVSKKK